MRIAVITLHDAGNVMRIRRQVASLDTRFEMRVVGSPGKRPVPDWGPDVDLEDVRIVTRGLPSSPVFWVVKYLEFLVKTLVRSARGGADVFFGHEIAGAVPAYIASRLTGGLFVYDAHELELDRSGPLLTSWLGGPYRRLVRGLSRRADLVVCASRERAEIMMREYPLDSMPVAVLNVTGREGLPQGPDVELDGIADRVAGRKVVIYQGVLAKERCLENLVAALSVLPEDVVLMMVGDGAVQRKLESMAEAAGTSDRLVMVGRVPADHVVSYMRLADVGVVIYRNTCRNNIHCSPNKLYDYCAVGLPVAGSDQAAVRSIVEDFEVGAVFDPESPESIAGALRIILDDEDRRRAMSARAEQVREMVNWENQSTALIEALEELADRGRS